MLLAFAGMGGAESVEQKEEEDAEAEPAEEPGIDPEDVAASSGLGRLVVSSQ